ncbi:hypothetical protein ACFLUU_02375 [Chloroflexota bacterium]
MDKYRETDKRRHNMDNQRKAYQRPEVLQVNLVPEEAVLAVCKNHENAGDSAPDIFYCSWPGQDPGMGGPVCRGVTGS